VSDSRGEGLISNADPTAQAEVTRELSRWITMTLTRADAFEIQLFLRQEAVNLAWFARDSPGSGAWRQYVLTRSQLATRLADDVDRWLA
jgi:hypothetical protein